MTRRTVRIAMNGVTGRMGYRQHLVRSILALRALAERHGLTEWSTDLDAVLADDTVDVYF
ncbi:gfo/Idh/MocA family oxidoreductase, partial [Streptomyces sp. NPDC058084]